MAKRRLALDVYMNKMYKIILYFVPLIALCAGVTFTILKSLGYYQDVNFVALVIFDATNCFYVVLGIFFAKNCEDADHKLKLDVVRRAKIIIALVIVVQWNFISYMIPSRDFWAYFVLFIMITMLFLDRKYVLHTEATVVLSIIISWIIRPDVLLPVKDKLFIPEMILRCILIIVSCMLMYAITFTVEKLLVRELENIAEYDSLTLLRNRRTLNLTMDDTISLYNKTEKMFCFVMADIDDFKVINDTYGHMFGDIVLKNISSDFVKTIGSKGTIFRYGGEEICALIYEDLDVSKKLCESLRKVIEKEIHTMEDIKVSVTMSFGLTPYKKDLDKEEMIKIADSNLYYAKNHGKNKVIS